jgi:serine phosphatase RsbU (regulator of sigma subunit)
VIRRDGSSYELDAPGSPPLGLFEPEYRPEAGETILEIDEQLLLYSDGVVERRDGDGNMVGLEPLVRSLADAARTTVAFAVASVQNAVLKASPEPLTDDSTLLAFRRNRD